MAGRVSVPARTGTANVRPGPGARAAHAAHVYVTAVEGHRTGRLLLVELRSLEPALPWNDGVRVPCTTGTRGLARPRVG